MVLTNPKRRGHAVQRGGVRGSPKVGQEIVKGKLGKIFIVLLKDKEDETRKQAED